MRITFVYPDYESLGLEYLMSLCVAHGFIVDFVHYNACDFFLGETKKGVSFKEVVNKIIETQPTIVAFSCVTDNYQTQLKCASYLKKVQSNIITVFGGVHVTAVPEKVLCNEAVDCVAIGEAEESFLKFIKECSKKVPYKLPSVEIQGMVFKGESGQIGKFAEGPLMDIDKIPYPYKNFNLDNKEVYQTITSRGCPFHCSYCFNSYFHQMRGVKALRRRKIADVIEELRYAVEAHAPRIIQFVDDSFMSNRKWLLEFCKKYKEEINRPFSCIANPSHVDDDTASMLKHSGCVHIQIGIQTFSEDLSLKVLDRKSSNADILSAINALKNAGLFVHVDHMLGIPGDSIELQEDSIVRFYNECRPDWISVFWLTYFPKTKIIDFAFNKGLLTELDIQQIENGYRLLNDSQSTLFGGDLKNPEQFYAIALLLNFHPLLPKPLVSLLVRSRLYRIFKIKNYFLSIAFPRLLVSLLNQKDYRGRLYIKKFIRKIINKLSSVRIVK